MESILEEHETSQKNTSETKRKKIVVKKRSVGRPKTKIDRTKIGLSLDGKSVEMLNELVERTGKTKSRIIEESIELMKTREDIIYERMLKYEKYGDEVLVSAEDAIERIKKSL